MRRVSPKRAIQNRLYALQRHEYLMAHPWCESAFNCDQRATDVHHMRGRVGADLLDEAHWMPLCRPCHDWAGRNPRAAIDIGMSERRIGRAG